MAWFKVDDGLHSHKKTKRAGVEAMGLWVVCGTWSSDNEEDGFVPEYVASAFTPRWKKHAERLVSAGLWTPGEKENDRGWFFHDFADYNPLHEKLEEKRREERERKAEWRRQKAEQRKRPADVPDVSQRDNARTDSGTDAGVRDVSALTRPDPTRPDPTRPENLREEEPTVLLVGEAPEQPRDDVQRLCDHLARNLIANGCKPPTIGKTWRDAARLMLDKDGHTEDQIHRCIDWATSDEFWRANVLSMPTLRTKYDQLRLAAQRTSRPTRQQQTDDMFERAMARAVAADAADRAQTTTLQIGA